MKSPVMFERIFIGFIFAAVLLITFGGINEGRTAEGDVAIIVDGKVYLRCSQVAYEK